MKTAIEWLIDKHFGGIENCTPDFRKHIEQAKEMEKQQIIDAYSAGEIRPYNGNKYYVSTFGDSNEAGI